MVHLLGSGYDSLCWAVTWISLSSITVQLYLVYLVARHTPGSMRSYRPFLLLISFWDFLLTFVLGITLVPELLYPASCVVINGPVRLLGYDVALITLCIAIVVGLNGKFTQDFCMAYRFVVVLRNERLKTLFLKPVSIVVMQFAQSGLSIYIAVLVCSKYFSAEGAIEYLHRWDNVTDPSDVWFLPPFDWNATILCDDVVSAAIQPTLHLLVYSGATIITLLEGTSIILAIAIFTILRRDRKAFSKQTYRMNMQMTALLVAQFLAPFLFMMLPLIILLGRRLLSPISLPTKSLGDAYVVAFSLYGYANSLLTLFFLAPYRRKLKEQLRWLAIKLGYKSKDGPNSVTVVSQSLSLTETSAIRRNSLRSISLRRATE